MTTEQKIQKLFSKLKTDGEDLYQLTCILKNDYDNEEDIDAILDDIVKVKDDVISTVNKLKKELK